MSTPLAHLADLPNLDRLLATADMRQLGPEATMALASIARIVEAPGGHQLLSDRTRSDALYMIARGRVVVTWRGEDRRAPLRTLLQPGDVFGEDALVPRGSVGATTLSSATLLRLEAAELRRLAAEHPDLARLQARMTAVQGRRGWVLRQLRRSSLFRHSAPADLAAMLRAAELTVAEPGELLHDGTEQLPGVLVVMEGDVLLRASGKVRVGRRTWQAPDLAMGWGSVIGDVALARDQPLLHDVVAGEDGCAVLMLPRDNFDQAFSRSLAFRRSILSSPVLAEGERTRLMMMHARKLGHSLRIFQTIVCDDDRVDVSLLTRWLAEAAADEWGDRVAILRPDPRLEGPTRVSVEQLGDGEVHTVRLNPSGPPPLELISTLVRCDMALLDIGALSRDEAREGPWRDRIQRFVVIGSRAYDFSEAELIASEQTDLPLYTAVVPSEPPEPGQRRTVPFGCARLHRDVLAECGRGAARRDLRQDHRDQVHRWMRAVTGRRLGVALGGGGALSFAELAVLQRLHEERIPVDMVAGVSGGAIVGAFYTGGMDQPLPPGRSAPHGLEDLPGLALLTLVGGEMEQASLIALVSGWSVVAFLERHLGHPRLEDLLVPFYPVSVDGDEAVQTHLQGGPLAYGARASGSFPGTFTPTTLDLRELKSRVPLPGRDRRDLPMPQDEEQEYAHHLDGGLLNNIPDDTLFLEGAQLVLACNVVPAPGPRRETGSRLALDTQQRQRRHHGRIARFLTELSPILRFDDLYRAIYMLLFQPADWASRTADVKYQASTRGFAFTAWGEGDAIRQQTLTEGAEAVEQALAQVMRARESLRWKRDQDVDYDALAQVVLERMLQPG